jgi:hypothetical protein
MVTPLLSLQFCLIPSQPVVYKGEKLKYTLQLLALLFLCVDVKRGSKGNTTHPGVLERSPE